MIELPSSITLELHFYIYAPYPGALTMFERKLEEGGPDWLYVFTHTVEVPVPENALQDMYRRIPGHFEAARAAEQKKHIDKILALDKIQSKLLAIEN